MRAAGHEGVQRQGHPTHGGKTTTAWQVWRTHDPSVGADSVCGCGAVPHALAAPIAHTHAPMGAGELLPRCPKLATKTGMRAKLCYPTLSSLVVAAARGSTKVREHAAREPQVWSAAAGCGLICARVMAPTTWCCKVTTGTAAAVLEAAARPKTPTRMLKRGAPSTRRVRYMGGDYRAGFQGGRLASI